LEISSPIKLPKNLKEFIVSLFFKNQIYGILARVYDKKWQKDAFL